MRNGKNELPIKGSFNKSSTYNNTYIRYDSVVGYRITTCDMVCGKDFLLLEGMVLLMEPLQLLAESVRIIAICYLLRTIGNVIIWTSGMIGVILGAEEE